MLEETLGVHSSRDRLGYIFVNDLRSGGDTIGSFQKDRLLRGRRGGSFSISFCAYNIIPVYVCSLVLAGERYQGFSRWLYALWVLIGTGTVSHGLDGEEEEEEEEEKPVIVRLDGEV